MARLQQILANCLTPIFFTLLLSTSTSGNDSFTMSQVLRSFKHAPSDWKFRSVCSWEKVQCNWDDKVTSVDLSKSQLSGTISPELGNLTYLRILFLQDNNLTGPIPYSLANLTYLIYLDVSNNNLSDPIPPFNSSVDLIIKGNPILERDISFPTQDHHWSRSHTRKGLSRPVIAVIVIACLIVIGIAIFVSYTYYGLKDTIAKFRSRYHSKSLKERIGNLSDRIKTITTISIQFLQQATDNFNETNILGRGGFGVVYRGILPNGTIIAVKRMKCGVIDIKGEREFQAEIAVLSKVRHRHLVSLLAYCVNGNERVLVYEFMPLGTLGDWLFDWNEKNHTPLSWKQRISIALDVARGIEYLHGQNFIHRDLKSSNILLGGDSELRAKVSDFGLVKDIPNDKHSIETKVAGTFGYLAPEYAATGKITTKVDVYAFGVVLLELITGRKAVDNTQPEEMISLVLWFRSLTVENEAIDKLIPSEEETMASISRVAELARHCTSRRPNQRPTMGVVVNVLGSLVDHWNPSSQEDESAQVNMSLDEYVQRWQAGEGTSSTTIQTGTSSTTFQTQGGDTTFQTQAGEGTSSTTFQTSVTEIEEIE